MLFLLLQKNSCNLQANLLYKYYIPVPMDADSASSRYFVSMPACYKNYIQAKMASDYRAAYEKGTAAGNSMEEQKEAFKSLLA